MNIIYRDITSSEPKSIYDALGRIEITDGIPRRKTELYQYILEDNGSVIGYVSGITDHNAERRLTK